MTSWGFQDCQRDPNNGGWGGALPKLLMRHFPAYYPNDNVYGIFPFFTPEKMKSSLTRQGIASQYKFDRPIPAVIPKYIDTFEAINYVFKDPTRFKSGYDMSGLGQGYGFMLAIDDRTQHDKDRALALHSLFPDKDAVTKYVKWWNETTAAEVNKQSWKYDSDYIPGNYVDIVNVIKTVGVHWAADTLCGISLKTKENPKGQYTVQEVFDLLATLFTYSFVALDDQEHLWSLRLRTIDAGTTIQEIVLKSLLDVAPGTAPGKANGILLMSVLQLFVVGVLGRIKNLVWAPTDKPYYDFLSRLGQSGRPLNELVAMVVGLAVGSSVNLAHGNSILQHLSTSYVAAAINVVDFYLDEERAKERAQIIALVQKTDATSDNLLQGYVREAMRFNPQFTGLYRIAAADAEVPIDDKHTLNIKSGDRIFASFRNAYINPVNFPNPDKVDPTRPAASYNMNGSGFHQCAGVSQAERAVAEVLRVVFKLKNIRRATGDAGVLNQSTRTPNFTHTPLNVYPKPDGTLSDWPVSMHLVYDS
ncbi:hypothetical protein SERLA73DRAFT_106133 [Serpula lacrymans var. lacrymans S7.3]|uniref:Cytochrome P450 n=1 Tax=Serpula lacrymans var. lacrymans (strain S7.3) TaxID=936435 RepID=F8PVI1_SERL3|nr:hypothetical protein SERLA73DRAFT_106133 [Serpula lacrymans var. lacrymans S7.3]